MPPAPIIPSRSLCHAILFLSIRFPRAVFYRKQSLRRKFCLSLFTHLYLRQASKTTVHLCPRCFTSSPLSTCTPRTLPAGVYSGGHPTRVSWRTSYIPHSSCTWTPISPLASVATAIVAVSGARLGGGSCGWDRERQVDGEWGWMDELDVLPPNYPWKYNVVSICEPFL